MTLKIPMTHITRIFRGIASRNRRPVWGRSEWLMLGISAVALAGMWFLVVSGFPIGAEQVVTHYSIPFGIDGIGPWWHTWVIPAAASVVTFVHVFVLAPWIRTHSQSSATFVHGVTLLLNLGAVWSVFLLRYQQLPT